MRLGIRLQLLLALGSLLVLAFLPLFFAVASLTRASLSQVRAQSATALGRAIAGHVIARAAASPWKAKAGEDLLPLLDGQSQHRPRQVPRLKSTGLYQQSLHRLG